MVRNTHQRLLAAPPSAVGRLLDGLAGSADPLWPAQRWPPMRLDRELGVGARGGHGPVRYHVVAYRAGSAVRFQFGRPSGFHGHHEFVVTPTPSGTLLRHSLVMRTSGTARLTWPLVFRPLHDALIEDSLDQASLSLGLPVLHLRRWNLRVRILRFLAALTSGTIRARAERLPANAE